MSAVIAYRSPAKKAAIGTRWTPDSIERFDRSTGFYEFINPPAVSAGDIVIQRALLAPPRKSWIAQCLAAISARRATKESRK